MARHARSINLRHAVYGGFYSRREWSRECSPGGHGNCVLVDCGCPCHRGTTADALSSATYVEMEQWHAELHRDKTLNPNRKSHRKIKEK